MKKLDYIVIITILAISIFLISSFYIVNSSNTNQDNISIEYNNHILYTLDLNEITEANINIYSDNNKLHMKMVVSSQVVLEKEYMIELLTESVNYEIVVTDSLVKVTNSLCPNKYCMHMRLSKTIKSPIICTDGLTIKYKSNLNIDISTGE